jgi:hypothetical protein
LIATMTAAVMTYFLIGGTFPAAELTPLGSDVIESAQIPILQQESPIAAPAGLTNSQQGNSSVPSSDVGVFEPTTSVSGQPAIADQNMTSSQIPPAIHRDPSSQGSRRGHDTPAQKRDLRRPEPIRHP